MDVTSTVIQAINGWLQSLAGAVTRPALQIASSFLFQTPAFDTLPDVQKLWAIEVGVADSVFILAAVAGGIMVMASGTFETLYSAKRLLPRLALAAVLTNISLPLCGALIALDNALVVALLGPSPATTLWPHVVAQLAGGDTGPQVLSSLISLALAAIALLLVLVYIGRDLILLVGTVIAPLALATYGLPQTDEIARAWGRAYAAALFVQVAQAELLNVGAQLIDHTDWLGAPASGLVSALVLITVLYLVLRLPFAAYKWAFGNGVSVGYWLRTLAATARSWEG